MLGDNSVSEPWYVVKTTDDHGLALCEFSCFLDGPAKQIALSTATHAGGSNTVMTWETTSLRLRRNVQDLGRKKQKITRQTSTYPIL